MKLGVLVLLVAGCRASRAPAPPLPTRTPYLMLFEQGRSFTLAAQHSNDANPQPKPDTARCTVVEVKQVGDANVSRLACDQPHASLLIAGTWVATPAGLYHPHLPIDDPDELALLGDDDLLIAARPRERDHHHALDRAQESVEAFPFDASWCVRQTTSAGDDRRGFVLCFDGAAITGGSDFVRAGGSWQRVELGASPPEDAED